MKKPDQHYIFPTEGESQEGDQEFIANDNGEFYWEPCNKGIRLHPERPIRRPVPSSPWISAAERLPTKEDGDAAGYVLHPTCGAVDANTVKWDSIKCLLARGHWMRIPPVPEPKQEDEFEKWWSKKDLATDDLSKATAREAWNAAREVKP